MAYLLRPPKPGIAHRPHPQAPPSAGEAGSCFRFVKSRTGTLAPR